MKTAIDAEAARAGKPVMADNTLLVMGATGGIGKTTALGLARLGAHVGTTGRDVARAKVAVLDLYPRLDVLVNNVGGFWTHRHVTADGLEHTFALKHLAPSCSPRCYWIGSRPASRPASSPWPLARTRSVAWTTTTCRVRCSTRGSRPITPRSWQTSCSPTSWREARMAPGLLPTCCTPELVRTAFGAEDLSAFFRLIFRLMRPFMKTTAPGAATSIYLAPSPLVKGGTGLYFSNSKPKESSTS